MLMLYAAVPAGACEDRPDGLDVLEHGGTGIVFASCTAAPSRERSAVLGFGRAVLQLARRSTILPMRYGTVVAGRPELSELLAERETEWRRRLEALEGHVEMLVRWESQAPSRDGGTSGRDYLLARMASSRLERDRIEGLLGALGQLTADYRILNARGCVRLACLVAEDLVPDFQQLLQAHASTTGEPAICTGPWPPFSFTQET